MTSIYWVRPSTEEGRKFSTQIRASDYAYLLVQDVPIALVWKDRQIDPEVLKKGLEQAVDLFPVVSARATRGTPLMFTNEGSSGALLEVHHIKGSMPNEESNANLWSKYFHPFIFRQFREPFGRPLMIARLNLFSEGGCALCINMAHSISDGAAIIAFLRAWSYFCGQASGNESWLPKEKPPQPDLDRSIPKESISTTKQARKLYELERAPFSTVVLGGVRVVLGNLGLDQVTDYKITAASMSELKKRLSEGLEKPKWISSYEALMSTVLRALAMAEKRQDITCRVIVNIRSRTPLASPEYFGNALSFTRVDLNATGPLSDSAFQFHEILRAGLEDKETLIRGHHAAEYHRMKGAMSDPLQRARYLKPFILAKYENAPVVNSWVGFNFFELDFGLSGQPADFMRVPPSFGSHRHIHAYPTKKDGEINIRIRLSPSDTEKFKLAIKKLEMDSVFEEIA